MWLHVTASHEFDDTEDGDDDDDADDEDDDVAFVRTIPGDNSNLSNNQPYDKLEQNSNTWRILSVVKNSSQQNQFPIRGAGIFDFP